MTQPPTHPQNHIEIAFRLRHAMYDLVEAAMQLDPDFAADVVSGEATYIANEDTSTREWVLLEGIAHAFNRANEIAEDMDRSVTVEDWGTCRRLHFAWDGRNGLPTNDLRFSIMTALDNLFHHGLERKSQ